MSRPNAKDGMPVLYANHSWSNRALTEVHVREFRVGRGLVGLWIVLRSAADGPQGAKRFGDKKGHRMVAFLFRAACPCSVHCLSVAAARRSLRFLRNVTIGRLHRWQNEIQTTSLSQDQGAWWMRRLFRTGNQFPTLR